MKCRPKWQHLAGRHRGGPLPWHCFKTIYTFINSAMRGLHTSGSVAL